MYDCLKLENQLCFPIYLCSKEIIRKYTPYLKKINLTYTQYIVMMYLWEHNETKLLELESKLLLDSNTLTPLLKKLEIKGYINRKRINNNLIVSLTKDGLKLKDNALEIPKEMGKCINLNEKDATALYNLIYKVLGNIEKR